MELSINKIKSGISEIIIMIILLNNDMYGYELAKRLKDVTDGVYDFSATSMYPILRQLEGIGLISSYTAKVGQRRTRQYYHMEEKGIKHLKAAIKQYNELVNTANNTIKTLGIVGTNKNI